MSLLDGNLDFWTDSEKSPSCDLGRADRPRQPCSPKRFANKKYLSFTMCILPRCCSLNFRFNWHIEGRNGDDVNSAPDQTWKWYAVTTFQLISFRHVRKDQKFGLFKGNLYPTSSKCLPQLSAISQYWTNFNLYYYNPNLLKFLSMSIPPPPISRSWSSCIIS